MSRVYAPLESAMLDQLLRGDDIAVRAFTATPQLRESFESFDEEELEHLATQLAAAACVGKPRAVVALEVAPHRIALSQHVLAGCEVADIRMKDVVCFFTTDDDVDEDADAELSWYDATEANVVREVLAPQ